MRNYDLTNPVHIARCVARERYAFPGGYELCVITSDGGLICSNCVRDNYRNILDSTKKDISDGWMVKSMTSESELEDEICSHCNKLLGYQSGDDVYTEEIHARRLLEMLNSDDICGCCPATPEFRSELIPQDYWNEYMWPCTVCTDFLDVLAVHNPGRSCPCHIFEDSNEAIKLTWLKLEEKGYI